MHFHVDTTTTAKLVYALDELSGPDAQVVTPHHMGGRDWVVVAQHADHEPLPADAAQAFAELLRRCDRMRDDWSECNTEGKRVLWSALHTAADNARPFVDDFDSALDQVRTEFRPALDTLAEQ